jgi:three-Cys-motif partner protein
LALRCFFLEKDPTAFSRLDAFASEIKDVEIRRENKALEEAVTDIVEFIKAGGNSAFSFVFVDPTGWSGFGMDVLKPLLQLRSSEVLVNFMTRHILRFIESDDPKKVPGFVSLFGSGDYHLPSADIPSTERAEFYVRRYCENLKAICDFPYTCAATILHPTSDQTHYHLIYATRSPKGIEEFKAVEKEAMKVQEQTRAETRKRRREKESGQPELFAAEEMHDSSYYDSLRERSLVQSKEVVLHELQQRKRVPYDDVWVLALSFALTWESDLKNWIAEWQKAGILDVEGLEPGRKVPQRGKQHGLVWQGMGVTPSALPVG